MKVYSGQEASDLCKRVLIKKQVKDPQANFKIENGSVTLKGKTSDKGVITDVKNTVSKVMPDVKIKNELKYRLPDNIKIIGVNTSGLQHVKMANGNKVFKGGKFSNNCTVLDIMEKKIILNCDGDIVDYKIRGVK